VRIRSATESDVDAVVALWQSAAGPSRSPGRHAEARTLIRWNPEALIVTDDDGRIVGTVIVGWDGWRCHLYRLAVLERWRRRGIASSLLAEARRRASQLGAARIDAMVRRDNAGAIAFWEQSGFALDDDDGRWSSTLPAPSSRDV
jgi:ribosomal protein S18 acetylase RimI-like enzyme